MHLKKLEIHGFKSFAKKTVLEFEPGITSIVGPNGSGKSNIADSLRWVFGEQSLKLLRGKKSEDVIFAGSDQKARLGAAEVMVHFDNVDHKMPIDYDEVSIGRRVYRDGNSEYVLNGSQVRLLDIEDLLAKSGFGNTSYFVIGQGTIDQLILRGPAGIKELLEEASGIKPYYDKRERALRRLDRTESNLVQVRALVAEIEPRLRSLRRQTRKLERRGEIEDELKMAYVGYFSQMILGMNRQVQEIAAKIAGYDKQIKDLNTEIKTLSADIEAQEKESGGAGAKYKKIRGDLDDLHKQKNIIQEQLAVIRGRLKIEAVKLKEAPTINWQALKDKFHSAYQRLVSLFETYDPAEAGEVKKLFTSVKEMIETAEGETPQHRQKEMESLKTEEKRLNVDLEKLFAKIRQLETDLENYAKEEEGTKQQLFVKERLLRNKQESLVKTSAAKNLLDVEQARLVTRRENYQSEAREALGAGYETLLTPEHGHPGFETLQERIRHLKKQLEVIGGVDDLTLQEFKETEERYTYLTTQSADLENGMKDLKTVIAELDEVIKKEFQTAFDTISEKFTYYFRMLFNGGQASMTILRERIAPTSLAPEGRGQGEGETEQSEPQGEMSKGRLEIIGIDLKATPPGKKLGGISALSGGERALTSIALLSAILATFPAPFVALDEVDAALDEANSIRFGKIVGTLAAKTQFITITHNRETMRQSHTLYGVTMGDDGISKVLSLKLEQAAVYSTKN